MDFMSLFKKSLSAESDDKSVKQEGSGLLIGHRVILQKHIFKTIPKNEAGTIRWIGILPDDNSETLTAGVDLDNAVGTGTGAYKDQRLFFTKHGHATLVPITLLIKEEDYHKAQAASSESQQTSSDQSAGQRRTSQGRDKARADRQQVSASSRGTTARLENNRQTARAAAETMTGSALQGSSDITAGTDDDFGLANFGLCPEPSPSSEACVLPMNVSASHHLVTEVDAAPNTNNMMEGAACPKQRKNKVSVPFSFSESANSLPVPVTSGMVADGSFKVPAADGLDGMAMAAAAEDFSPTERECVVCHEDFTEPKVLPCGHMLCRKCLISWMKTQTEACCPMCRSRIMTGSEMAGKTLEEIADTFYTDHFMKAVVEAADFLSKQHACKACVNSAALFLCLTCGDALCSSCMSVHAKLSTTSDHSVEDLASLTPEQLAAKSMVPCVVHKDRPSDLFCQTHGVAVCLPCARADHRRCGEVQYLEEHRENSHRLVSDLTDTLSAAEARMMQKVEQLDNRLLSMEEVEQRGLAYIDEKCNHLTKAIMKCRHRLTEQVHKKCSGQKRSVVEEKTSLLNERGKLRLHGQMMNRVQKLPVVDDTKGLRQTVKRCVDNADQVDISQDQQLLQLEFAVDENLLAKIEEDLSALHIN